MSDIFSTISVGAVRAANEAVERFFNESAEKDEPFDPEDVVALVLDTVRTYTNDIDVLDHLDFKK